MTLKKISPRFCCKVVKSSPHHGSASLRHPIGPGKNEQNHALSVTAIPLLIWQGHVSHFHPPIIINGFSNQPCRALQKCGRSNPFTLVSPSFQTIADTPSPAVALHPYAEANIINTVVFALNTSAFKLFFFRES